MNFSDDSPPASEYRDKPALSVKLVLVTYGAMFAAALVWGWFRGELNVFVLDSQHGVFKAEVSGSDVLNTALSVLMALGCGIAGGLLVVWLSRLAVKHLEGFRRMQDAFASMLGEMSGLQVFTAAAASAVAEEALFRGVMMVSWGIWISSIVFGILHAPADRRMFYWPLLAFLMGLGFGGLALLFGNILAPVAAHFTINLLNLRKISAHARILKKDSGNTAEAF